MTDEDMLSGCAARIRRTARDGLSRTGTLCASDTPTSSLAYVLVEALRRLGLGSTKLARATVGTIRLKLLTIGAQVTVSLRRVKLALSSGYPYKEEFHAAYSALRGLSAAAR